jgi:DNA-binding NtrC family response regulator
VEPDEYDDKATRLRSASPGQATRFELRIVAGRDAGHVLVVEPDEPAPVIAGQSPVCALRLGDDEVSRRHASFEPDGSMLRLTDLRSTNGTFVNGLRVFEAALYGGETVQMGSTALRVTPRPAAAASEVSATSFGPVLGASAVMRRLYPVCERLALARVPVVIEGETGTGKELMAEAFHRVGPRKSGPFLVFDCASTYGSEVEAALFGERHEPGVFELAHRGTLLLDEIAELPLDVQGKLLRVIDRGELRRVGATTPVTIDTRVIATTQRDLDAEVQAGRFREDLFFRLAVARIELPPLRKRMEDVPMLLRHFWWSLQGPGDPPPELVERLATRDWPGNVRELANVVARALTLGDLAETHGGRGSASATSGDDVFEEVLAERLPLPRAREKVVDAFERRYVERVLAEHGGNVSRAAAASGLALRYFQVLRARQAKGQGSG